MADNLMTVYVDFLSNQPKSDQARENFGQMRREKFERNLPDAVDRIWKLPQLVLKEPSGDYLELLKEVRELFIDGYFYSCVAMCGIVGERLVKDMFRASILIDRAGGTVRPTGTAFDQLERVDVNGIIRFLKETELLSDEACKATENSVN